MCTLKIYSETMSFRLYATETTLPVTSCHEKGQVRRQTSGATHESHRISIAVSDKEWDDFKGQVTDAIDFLSRNEEDLSTLLFAHNANGYLDFPLYSRLDGNIVNQNDLLPRELIALAGRLGLSIEMAIYDKAALDEHLG